MGYTPCKTVYRFTREQLHLNNAKQSFPILTNESRVWLIKHLYHHVIFTERKKYSLQQGKLCIGTVKINSLQRGFRYSGARYSRVCFPIFYCNSARLSNVVHYNGVFVIARFVVAGCRCIINILITDLSRSVWENVDLDHVYRPRSRFSHTDLLLG